MGILDFFKNNITKESISQNTENSRTDNNIENISDRNIRELSDFLRFAFFYDEEKYLRYSYYDVKVKGVEYRNFDISKIEIGHQLYFDTEPENKYDPNAIKILYDDIHIGYIPKNNLQEMMLQYSDGIERVVCGMTTYVDEKTKTINIGLGFYEKFNKNNIDIIDTKIIPSENKDIVEKHMGVNLEYDEQKELYLVKTLPGLNLGVINKVDSQKIRKFEEDGLNIKAGIFEINNNQNLEMKCTIKVIIR